MTEHFDVLKGRMKPFEATIVPPRLDVSQYLASSLGIQRDKREITCVG